jgi:hypothetical protein
VATSSRGSTQPGALEDLDELGLLDELGMIWTALAPVPITATRLPVKS